MLELATPTLNRVGLAPSEGTRPHPPASHHAHFSGALLAPTFRPVEPRAPLSLPPGGQSSRRGGILGAGSSGVRSLGLRPRFFPPARLFFSSFLGTSESWLLCLGSGSAEVRNQFSAWVLRMWYLTPLSELNSFGHNRQQYFPTRWSPLLQLARWALSPDTLE